MSQTPQEKRAIYNARKAAGVCVKCGTRHDCQRVLCAECRSKKALQAAANRFKNGFREGWEACAKAMRVA